MSKKAARKINHSHSLANRVEADKKSADAARERDGLGKTGHKVGKNTLNNKQNKS